MTGLEKYLSEEELGLLVCVTCGTQYDTKKVDDLPVSKECVICNDERQWAPESGAKFSTLAEIQHNHKVTIAPDSVHPDSIQYMTAEPRFGIGQRAIIFHTPEGGVWIWDCIAVLTNESIEHLKGLGKKIEGIVISHPHFYTTSLSWAVALDVPVYVSHQDLEWYQRRLHKHASKYLRPISQSNLTLSSSISTICVGGHFPGSRVFLHSPTKTLGVADSIYVTPRRTASFMWSYPNLIPLRPEQVQGIWDSVKVLHFDRILGGFDGQDIKKNAKKVVAESAKLWLTAGGWDERGLGLRE